MVFNAEMHNNAMLRTPNGAADGHVRSTEGTESYPMSLLITKHAHRNGEHLFGGTFLLKEAPTCRPFR